MTAEKAPGPAPSRRSAQEIHKDWLTVLAEFDPEMGRWGFKRSRRSYEYKCARGDIEASIYVKGEVGRPMSAAPVQQMFDDLQEELGPNVRVERRRVPATHPDAETGRVYDGLTTDLKVDPPINTALAVRSGYGPKSAGHEYFCPPLIEVVCPGLEAKINLLAEGAGFPTDPSRSFGRLHGQIAHTEARNWRPWPLRKEEVPWPHMTGVEEMRCCMRGFIDYMEEWIFPVLDQIETFDGLVSAYHRGDVPVLKGGSLALRIAAIEAAEGRPEDAASTIRKHLESDIRIAEEARACYDRFLVKLSKQAV